MKEHYNLHYLLLEDMEQHPLPDIQRDFIRKNIENFFEKIKPPQNAQPLITRERNPPITNNKKENLL